MLSYYRNMIDWKENTCIISSIERNLQIYEFIFLFLM